MDHIRLRGVAVREIVDEAIYYKHAFGQNEGKTDSDGQCLVETLLGFLNSDN